MDPFLQSIVDLLHSHFPGSEVEIERIGEQRVSGFLTWDGFVGREQIERQRAVWAVLRQALPPEEQRRVAAILTLTPEEMTAARAG